MFDWDLNALEMYNKEQMKPKEKTYLKQMVQKNLYSSDLFNNNSDNNVKGNNVGYSNTLPNKKKYYAHSDIFNIKNDSNNNERESKRKGNSIRRVNKNAESMSLIGNNTVNSNSNNTERGIKGRIATQLQISKDNPFYC